MSGEAGRDRMIRARDGERPRDAGAREAVTIEHRILAGTTTKADVEYLAESNETLAAELADLRDEVDRLTAALKDAERELENRKKYSRLERKGWQDAARLYEQALEDDRREIERLREALKRIAAFPEGYAPSIEPIARKALQEPASQGAEAGE